MTVVRQAGTRQLSRDQARAAVFLLRAQNRLLLSALHNLAPRVQKNIPCWCLHAPKRGQTHELGCEIARHALTKVQL